MKKTSRLKKGFIGIIVLVIVAIIFLSYLGFDLKKIFTSAMVQKNFSYVTEFLKTLWAGYLSKPFTFVWGEMFKPLMELMWKAFLAGIDGIKSANAK